MRPSLKKHNVARLRVLLNEFEAEFNKKFDQEEFAKLIDCSVQKLRNIETGRTKLDELLAWRIADKTGVAIKWLMDGNLAAPPISTSGREYTKEIYAEAQARKKRFATVEDFNVTINVLEIFRVISAILVNANRKRNYHLAAYRMFKAIDELSTEFGEAKDLYSIKKAVAYVLGSDASRLPAVTAATLYEPLPEDVQESLRRVQQMDLDGTVPKVEDLSRFHDKQPTSKPKSKRPSPKRLRKALDSSIFRRPSVSQARGSARR